MSRLNIHIYPSPLTHESRILRITHALDKAKVFDRFEVFGVAGPDLPDRQQADERITFVRFPRKLFKHGNGLIAKVAKTLEWSARILASLRGRQVQCINAHSLAVLPLCYVASRMTGARLVYDTHELETETSGYKGTRQKMGRVIENMFIRRCDTVFVVSDAIADWYAQRYGIARPTVVRNIPEFTPSTSSGVQRQALRVRLGVKADEILYIYQGGFIHGRGIERLLEVFAHMPADRHLMCMGSGPLKDLVVQASQAASNIHLLPPVAPHEVLGYTLAADIGICLTDNSCLSHYYSLPNKVFEYLHAGLPIIVNPLLEQERMVQTHGCGWVAPSDDAQLQALLAQIDANQLAERAANAAKAAQAYTWAGDAQRLVERYRSDGLA